MNPHLSALLTLLCFSSCVDSSQDLQEEEELEVHRTYEEINLEFAYTYNDEVFLSSAFGLTEEECVQLCEGDEIKVNRKLRERIMQKFILHLCDTLSFAEPCKVLEGKNNHITYNVNPKIRHFSLYCLAKIEIFPFAQATGWQNCTEPWISNEIMLPINFSLFGDYRCDFMLERYKQYFVSKTRDEYIERYGYR